MSELIVVRKVDWDTLPQDVAMLPNLSRRAGRGEPFVMVPASRAATAVQRIAGSRSIFEGGDRVEVTPDIPAEAKLAYFKDGWTDAGRPRITEHTEAVMRATVGYGLATRSGHLVATFATLAEATAAHAAYDAKQGPGWNPEAAAAEAAAHKLDEIKKAFAPAIEAKPSDKQEAVPSSPFPDDKRYTARKGKPLVTATELAAVNG